MRYPGFIDSHLHVLGLGYVHYNVDLTKTTSLKETIHLLKDRLEDRLLIARGWNQNNWQEERMLTKEDLNKVSRSIPIVAVRVCGHVLTVNDKMLEIANIQESTPQIEGGHFDTKTGIFSEKALELIYQAMPKPTKADLRTYFIKANEILLANGVTSVASDDFCIFPIPYEEVIDVMKELYEEDLLQIRITEQVNLSYQDLQDFIAKGYVNQQFGKLRMGPHKILADGSLGGKTAALNQPYQDDETNFGILTFSDQELFEKVHLANQNGMDVVAHAIGDRSVDQILDALEQSIQLTKRLDHHHAIIHAQLTTKKQIQRMKDLGVGAIVQPIFLNTDLPIIEKRIGSRAEESYLFHTMHEQGLRVGFSTDSPIEPVNPFWNIYTAMTRKSIQFPEYKPFYPQEGFSLETALECYTNQNLWYVYETELPNGDYIEVDLELISKPSDLLQVTVQKTVIDHQVVYERKTS